MAGKALVAYFSANGGATQALARRLAKVVDADVFGIAPQVPYTEADLDWRDPQSRSTLEMKDESCRPAFVGRIGNIDLYDTVFVGFPIWWYVEPRIVDTFLEAYDLFGKTIVPFATSGSSGMGDSAKRIAELCPGSTVLEGKRFNASAGEDELAAWVATL